MSGLHNYKFPTVSENRFFLMYGSIYHVSMISCKVCLSNIQQPWSVSHQLTETLSDWPWAIIIVEPCNVFIFSVISQSYLSNGKSSVCLSHRICCGLAVCLCKLLWFGPHLWFERFAPNQWKHMGQLECRTAVEVLWVQAVCDVLGAREW